GDPYYYSCRNQPEIYLVRFVITERIYLAFFENAQQIGLHVNRYLCDFIQEKCSFVSRLDAPDHARTPCAAERPFNVAEEFASQNFSRHAAAVEGNKRTLCTAPALMDRLGKHLLPYASLPQEKG